MKLALLHILFILLFFININNIFGQTVCYIAAESNGGVMFEYNLENNSFSNIGSLGLNNIEALALGPNGTLYATTNGDLYSIILQPLSATLIGSAGSGIGENGIQVMGDIDGLTFDRTNNILYASNRVAGSGPGSNDYLFILDPATGNLVAGAMRDYNNDPVDYAIIEEAFDGTAGQDAYDVDDIAFNNLTGELFASQTISFGDTTPGVISKIDNTNGLLDQIVWDLIDDDIEGLSFSDDGKLYGTTGNEGIPNQNSLILVDYDGLTVTDLGVIDSMVNDFESVDCYTCNVNIDTLNISDISCYGFNDGVIDCAVTGNFGSYDNIWSLNGIITSDNGTGIVNAEPGVWLYKVTDQLGCTDSVEVIIEEWDSLSTSYEVTNNLCAGDSFGAIDPTVSGGIFPYSFEWSTGSIFQNISNLPAGNYELTITDGNNCSKTDEIAIADPDPIDLLFQTIDNLCAGDSLGEIDLFVSGGTLPYSLSWSNGSMDEDIDSLLSGTYIIEVTDLNNCFITDSIEITEPPEIELTYDLFNNLCAGDTNGSIELFINGGLDPYNFLWSDNSTDQNINDLPDGDYSVTVTDQNNCFISEDITLTDPPLLSVNLLCNGVSSYNASDGIAQTTFTGGTLPLTDYSWDIFDENLYQFIDYPPGGNNSTIYDLDPGIYQVTIIDANGCSDSSQCIVDSIPAPCIPPFCTTFADQDSYQLICDSVNICANTDPNAFVPPGYDGIFILTNENAQVLEYNIDSCFNITNSGIYNIHCFIFFPLTFDLDTIITGSTTISDINELLIQGGGVICGGLDTIGATITVFSDNCELDCSATAVQDTFILESDSIEICAVSDTLIPYNYNGSYFLTSTDDLQIQDHSNNGCFYVYDTGYYRIHCFIYDPLTFDVGNYTFEDYTISEIDEIINQDCDSICASIDTTGALLTVIFVNCEETEVIANPDNIETIINEPIDIESLINDIPEEIKIINFTRPTDLEGNYSGSAVLYTDSSGFTFTPGPDSIGLFCWEYYIQSEICPLAIDTAEVCVEVICELVCNFSEYLTSNNDGKNEILDYSEATECCTEIEMIIFNRWGGIVHKNNNILLQNYWDGGNDGEVSGINEIPYPKVPSGTYYYILKCNINDVVENCRGFIEVLNRNN